MSGAKKSRRQIQYDRNEARMDRYRMPWPKPEAREPLQSSLNVWHPQRLQSIRGMA